MKDVSVRYHRIDEIKEHRFFKDINFEEIKSQKYQGAIPYIPFVDPENPSVNYKGYSGSDTTIGDENCCEIEIEKDPFKDWNEF